MASNHDLVQWSENDHHFHVSDDHNDSMEHSTELLNKYFESGYVYAVAYEEEMIDDDDDNDNSDTIGHVGQRRSDDDVLSQGLSQVSMNEDDRAKRNLTPTSSPSHTTTKRIKISESSSATSHETANRQESEQEHVYIPAYLSAASSFFDNWIRTNGESTLRSMAIDDMRQVAILKHRIAALSTEQQIFSMHLRLGTTGIIVNNNAQMTNVDRRYWPTHVKSMMTSTTTTTSDENENDTCEKLVRERLRVFDEQIIQYRRQLDDFKVRLVSFTASVEAILDAFIRQYGIETLRMKLDLKLAVLEYEYTIEILERQFVCERPNEYQIQVAKRIYEAKNDYERARRTLIGLKQRVSYNKPVHGSSMLSTSMSIRTTNEQQTRTDLIAVEIVRAEARFNACQTRLSSEMDRLWKNDRSRTIDQRLSRTLIMLIEQRLATITDKWRAIYRFKEDYYLRTVHNDIAATVGTHQQYKQSNVVTGFASCLLVNTAAHTLSEKHIELLHRGPCYVPSYQMHGKVWSSPSSSQATEEMLRKQYAPLKHQITSLFSKYRVNIALLMEIQEKIYEKFRQLFSKPLPNIARQRGIYEMNMVQSIRRVLQANSTLVLRRTADNTNTFYLGNRKEFDDKANEYLQQTDAFQVHTDMNENYGEQQWQSDWNEMVASMNAILDSMLKKKAITRQFVDKFRIDASKIKLPYLYFLPRVTQDMDISVVPIISTYKSPTWKLAKYLNRLLRPFIFHAMRSTILVNETDFGRKLNEFCQTESRLQSATTFVTLHVTNYYHLVSHSMMTAVLGYFLTDNLATNRLKDLTIVTIQNLVQLVLYNNHFYYDGQIYTCTKGGPVTMELIDTLSNVYLHEWQALLVSRLRADSEFFGRYKDQVVFTWNASIDKLHSLLDIVRKKHSFVQFSVAFGASVQFFDAHIENQYGQLYSRVDRQSYMQRYSLPYVGRHAVLEHSDWLRYALVRAVCYCTSVTDFNHERVHLELSYLCNGYSLLFVETRIEHFFSYFNASAMRYSSNQAHYEQFRQQIFAFIDRQHERSVNDQQIDSNDRLFRFNYIYEFGPRYQFNEDFRRLWSTYFANDDRLSSKSSKIQLTTMHRRSLNVLLSRQKPCSSDPFVKSYM